MEGRGEGGFKDAEFGSYHELLISRGNGEVGINGGGEVDNG